MQICMNYVNFAHLKALRYFSREHFGCRPSRQTAVGGCKNDLHGIRLLDTSICFIKRSGSVDKC